MAHPVVWFEVLGEDGAKLQQFYASLFGWRIDANNPMKYGMVETGAGKGIPGGVGGTYQGMPTGVTFYVECPDLEESLASAKKLGATVVMPVTKMPDGPTMAVFKDPEGHVIGMTQARPVEAQPVQAQ